MYEHVKVWLALNTDKRAVTALEYGLIAAVIAGVVIVGFTLVGTNVEAAINGVATKIVAP